MKKSLFILTLLILIMGCKKEGCTDYTALNYNVHAEQNDGSCEYNQYENLISGQITENLTLTSDKVWTLQGRVSVVNGTTLTIEPGTIIKAVAGTGSNASCLMISRGSLINAQGTAEQPIVFTSVADDIEIGQLFGTSLNENVNGLWGGLIVLGDAPISASGNMLSVQIEGIPASDPSGIYGGDNPNDNSGVLSYISIRHGGANIGEGNEINGLTLGGVGSSTVINNIEIVANQDDGIEWFGGNVNCSNLLVWGTGDDCIDIDQGYNGDLTNVLIIPTQNGDHVLEIDGGEGQWNAPFTIDNCEVISDVLEQSHFRADAVGYISLFGNVNVEADAGTAVVVSNGIEVDQSLFDWTYYNHSN
tara:strand:+ start:91 stop:1173 length:1083 start_codon:yes stop_codon:yes gene_type:complete